MNKEESRLPALEKIASVKVVKLERTFSRDLETERQAKEQKKLELLKESLHVEAMREREWYITLFSNPHPPLWLVFIIGYFPGVAISSVCFATKKAAEVPKYQNGSILDSWKNASGVDTYCWPGVKSGMIWYLLGSVPFFIVVAMFFRVKAIQMVRILRGNTLKHLKNQSMSTITQWQRQMSDHKTATEMDEFYLKSSALTLFIICVAWTLGMLHSIFNWGMSIPFGVVCFLQGLIHVLAVVIKKI